MRVTTYKKEHVSFVTDNDIYGISEQKKTRHQCLTLYFQLFVDDILYGNILKLKLPLYLFSLSWLLLEVRYSAIYSYLRPYMEVLGQLYAPRVLSPGNIPQYP
jgi:hypothetical protein